MPEVEGETVRDLAKKIQTTNNPWEAEALAKKMLEWAKQDAESARIRRREQGERPATA